MIRTRLIELRAKRSRLEVAENLGITPQMLGAIERGDRNPSLKLANKIAEYYKVSLDEIFFNQIRNEMCPNNFSTTISS